MTNHTNSNRSVRKLTDAIAAGTAGLVVATALIAVPGSVAPSSAGQSGLSRAVSASTDSKPTQPINPSPEQAGEVGRPSKGIVSDAAIAAKIGNADPLSFVHVEIVHHAVGEAVEQAVVALGGTVTGSVPGSIVEADVPARAVVALQRVPNVDTVREPLSHAPLTEGSSPGPEQSTSPTNSTSSYVGEEVQKTRANAYHRAGITGNGVRVGIIDSFDGAAYTAAINAGQARTPSGVFCRRQGMNCDIWASRSKHGGGVAEIITEMAPGALLYLASAETASDLQAAVNFFANNGVKIITRSETARYDGPGNGTGPIATVIANAASRGITWFNSAGNSAGRANVRPGSYYRGRYADRDRDNWHEFANGDELLSFNCGYSNGLRWDDWGTSRTDYDAYVYNSAGTLIAKSESAQPTAEPLEHPRFNCRTGEVLQLAVKLYSVGNGTTDDTLEFQVNGTGIEHWQNYYAAGGPMTDSKWAIGVGAIDPPLGTALAAYSSWGPTNDGRLKPEISAAACVRSYTYAPGCFSGTSAATPVVAGAAALLISGRYATTPTQIRNYLLTRCVVDRGAAGDDYGFGRGELILPVS